MVALQVFREGDVYLDYPYEEVKFRFEKATEKTYRRFYGEEEQEIDHSMNLYREAIAAGDLITREQYFADG